MLKELNMTTARNRSYVVTITYRNRPLSFISSYFLPVPSVKRERSAFSFEEFVTNKCGKSSYEHGGQCTNAIQADGTMHSLAWTIGITTAY
jgi:hypothetical protein